MHIQQSALKNLTVATIARRRVGRGSGGGVDTTDNDDNDDDENEDLNSNTTIKQCMGERGANNDGGDRQLAVGNVDDIRRQQNQALKGEDDG